MKRFSRKPVNRFGVLHYFYSFFLYFMVLLACKCLENSKITVSNDIQMKTKLFGKNDFEQARFIKLLSISFGPKLLGLLARFEFRWTLWTGNVSLGTFFCGKTLLMGIYWIKRVIPIKKVENRLRKKVVKGFTTSNDKSLHHELPRTTADYLQSAEYWIERFEPHKILFR